MMEAAAEALNLTADRRGKLKLVDEVVEEPLGGAHRDPGETAARLKAAIIRHLDLLSSLPRSCHAAHRAALIASFGEFSESKE